MTRRIRLDIEIQELEEGSYQPVVLQKLDSSCGGVFQLRAGMSRRIKGNNDPSTFHMCINRLNSGFKNRNNFFV